MTAFENYLQSNGFALTHGKETPLNTYHNCSRRWENLQGQSITIGTLPKFGIMVIQPRIDNLPTQDFGEYLTQVQFNPSLWKITDPNNGEEIILLPKMSKDFASRQGIDPIKEYLSFTST